MKCEKKDMLVYAITDRHWLHGRTLEEVVAKSIAGGITFLQLREKNLQGEELLQEALAIQKLCRAHGIPFIINDDVEMALKIGADGVHVGQDDMSVAEARAKLGPDKILGVSAHNVEEALRAQTDGADYLGSGAVFGTTSKGNVTSLPLETLRAICEAVSIPVVAIGGVSHDNVAELAGTGIAGVAVISAIYGQENIEEATASLRKLVEEIV